MVKLVAHAYLRARDVVSPVSSSCLVSVCLDDILSTLYNILRILYRRVDKVSVEVLAFCAFPSASTSGPLDC